MSSRRAIGSIHFDSSAFIPLVDASHALHNKIVSYLGNERTALSIDAVVLSEVLAGSNPEVDRAFFVRTYSKQFRVFPFDVYASQVCAELFGFLKRAGQIPRQNTDCQITKADLMILAAARVNGATEFVFEDRHFSQYPRLLPKSICGHSLPVFKRLSDLPDIMVQQEIPGLEAQVSSDSEGV